MKAARQYNYYRERWEEANLNRLVKLAEITNETINQSFKRLLIVANLLLFISYQALKGLYLIIKLLLLSEPSLKRIERDETWIFRQIK